MCRYLLVPAVVALAVPGTPEPSHQVLVSRGRAIGDTCRVEQTENEVMDVVLKRDGVEVTAGQGRATLRDRFVERVVSINPAGDASGLVRRYDLATCYRAHAVPTGKAMLSKRPIVGNDITILSVGGRVVLKGCTEADEDDRDTLTGSLTADPGRLLPAHTPAVGETWSMPDRALCLFGPDTTGSGSCRLERASGSAGGHSAEISFQAAIRSVDAKGRHKYGRVTGSLLWDTGLSRPLRFQFECVHDMSFSTTRGAAVVDVTGHGTEGVLRRFTWSRVAGRLVRP